MNSKINSKLILLNVSLIMLTVFLLSKNYELINKLNFLEQKSYELVMDFNELVNDYSKDLYKLNFFQTVFGNHSPNLQYGSFNKVYNWSTVNQDLITGFVVNNLSIKDLALNTEYNLNFNSVDCSSYSMEPTISCGDYYLEQIKPTPEQINIGDIIVFDPDWHEGLVIHRVIDKKQNNEITEYLTKGDNRCDTDSWTSHEKVLSKVLALFDSGQSNLNKMVNC